VSPAQVFKIARREYLARVRSKAFMIMTAVVPAFLGLYMFSAPMLMRTANTDLRLAILDAGTDVGGALADQLRAFERPHVVVTETATLQAADPAARDRFNAAIRAHSLDGYVVIEPDESRPARVRYYARETGNAAFMRDLRLAVQSAALIKLFAGTGVDSRDVKKAQQLDIDVVTVSERGERRGGVGAAMASTMALAMLLYLTVLINGQGMATAIVEEKSSRLIEVILGAVTATEFMAGKIVGVLASGLTQLGIWVLVAIIALVQAAPALAMSSAMSGFDLSTVLNARMIFYFSVFFSLGYALYCVLFAVVAVTCTSTEELGQSMLAAVMPMVVAMLVALSVISNPATTITRVLSLIPFFTPLVMMARVNVLMPPLWEVWLGVTLLAATTIVASWSASKIFRYALLMTGKRPTLPELIRVVKAG
jgi:ABC-2 type transport system permease protein